MARRIDLALKAADLNGYDIAVEYDHGTAVLAGAVRTREQKELASQVVSQVPGVHRVDNRLTSTGHAPTSTYTAARFRRPEATANPTERPLSVADEDDGLLGFVRTASTSTEDLQDPFLSGVEHADFEEVEGKQADSKIEQIAQRTMGFPAHDSRDAAVAANPQMPAARADTFDATKSFDQIFEEAVAQQETADYSGRYEELPAAPVEAAAEPLIAENTELPAASPLPASSNPFEGLEPVGEKLPDPLAPEIAADEPQQTEWMNASVSPQFDSELPPQSAAPIETVAMAESEAPRNNFIVESSLVAPRMHTSPLLVTDEGESTGTFGNSIPESNPFAEMQATAELPEQGPVDPAFSADQVTEVAEFSPSQSADDSEARLESFTAFRRSVENAQSARIHSNSGATVLPVDPSPAGWAREPHSRQASATFVPKRAEQLAQLSESLQPEDPAPAPPLSGDFVADPEEDRPQPAVATFLAPVSFDDEPRREDVREPMSTGASLALGLLLIVACLAGVGLRQRLPAIRRRLRI